MDRLKSNKGRQGKLLTEHLTGHRVLPSTKEELAQILVQRAKKEAERQMAVEASASQRASADQIWADPPRVVQACIVATFGRRAREAALVTGATMDHALEAEKKATAEVDATLSAASTMRE